MPTLQAPSPGVTEAMEARVMSVRVEQRGAVGTVIIDRPERKNAVDGPTSRALAEAFRAVEADTATRAAVQRLEGSFAIVVMSDTEPGTLLAAKSATPIVIGVTMTSTAIWAERRCSARSGWYKTLNEGLSIGCLSIL